MVYENPSFIAEGREKLFSDLNQRVEKFLTGKPQVYFLAGDAGVGKTTLLKVFSSRVLARSLDVLVSSGHCDHLLGSAYQPFKEILELLAGKDVMPAQQDLIGDEEALRLHNAATSNGEDILKHGAALIDTFVARETIEKWRRQGRRIRRQSSKSASLLPIQSDQLFEQYCNTLLAIALKRPLILLIDNLHEADIGTIDLLAYLTRKLSRVQNASLLLLGTYRDVEINIMRGEQENPLLPVIRKAREQWGNVVFDLHGLIGGQPGRVFFDKLLSTEPNHFDSVFRDSLFNRSEGNPLFTIELLRMLQEKNVLQKDSDGFWYTRHDVEIRELPERIDVVIEERINLLKTSLREILTCASVEGEQFTAEVIMKVRHLEELKVAEELDRELDRRYRLVGTQQHYQFADRRLHTYRFAHRLFREYIYTHLGPLQREELHRAVGEALEILYSDNIDEIAVQLARHFQEAGQERKSAEYYLKAGQKAQKIAANQQAIVFYQQAEQIFLQLSDAAQDLYTARYNRAYLYHLTGETSQQQEILDALIRQAMAEKKHDWLIESRNLRLSYLAQLGDYAQAKEYGEETLKFAQQGENDLLKADAEIRLGEIYAYLAAHNEALSHFRTAEDIFKAYRQKPGQALALQSIALVYLNRNDYKHALRYAQRALNFYREQENLVGEQHVLRYIGDIYAGEGDYQQALILYEQVLHIRQQIGYRTLEGGALGDMGDVYLFIGNYPKSLDLHYQSLAINEEVGRKYGQTWCHHDIGVIHYNLDNLEQAIEELSVALAMAEEIQVPQLIVLAKNDLSLVHRTQASSEDLQEALQQAQDATSMSKQHGLVYGEVVGYSYQAQALLALDGGRSQDALEASTRAVTLLEAHGTSEVLREEIFYNHFLILQQLEKEDEAAEYLNFAFAEIQRKAAKIQSPEMRLSFLQNIRLNRNVTQQWNELQK